MSCTKAQEFLELKKWEFHTIVDARKVKIGKAEALNLIKRVNRVIAVKGKKIVSVDLKKEKFDPNHLLSLIIGPSGNLRAPSIKHKDSLIVGFNEDTYRLHF